MTTINDVLRVLKSISNISDYNIPKDEYDNLISQLNLLEQSDIVTQNSIPSWAAFLYALQTKDTETVKFCIKDKYWAKKWINEIGFDENIAYIALVPEDEIFEKYRVNYKKINTGYYFAVYNDFKSIYKGHPGDILWAIENRYLTVVHIGKRCIGIRLDPASFLFLQHGKNEEKLVKSYYYDIKRSRQFYGVYCYIRNLGDKFEFIIKNNDEQVYLEGTNYEQLEQEAINYCANVSKKVPKEKILHGLYSISLILTYREAEYLESVLNNYGLGKRVLMKINYAKKRARRNYAKYFNLDCYEEDLEVTSFKDKGKYIK